MGNNNIIQFPLHKRVEKIFNEQVNLYHIENNVDEVFSTMLTSIYDYGYDIDEEEYIYDVSLAFEAVRSLVLNSAGQSHPLQEFSKSLFTRFVIDDQEKNDPSQLEFDF